MRDAIESKAVVRWGLLGGIFSLQSQWHGFGCSSFATWLKNGDGWFVYQHSSVTRTCFLCSSEEKSSTDFKFRSAQSGLSKLFWLIFRKPTSLIIWSTFQWTSLSFCIVVGIGQDRVHQWIIECGFEVSIALLWICWTGDCWRESFFDHEACWLDPLRFSWQMMGPWDSIWLVMCVWFPNYDCKFV